MAQHFHASTPADYSLDNMRALMDYLENPQENLRVVHVAGTSGKTSTAYYVSAFLTAGGQKVGLSVSPHVDEINERVQVNGSPLAEAEFCRVLTEFMGRLEKLPVDPSRFEVMAAFSYWYFAKEKVDYAVMEVGLGGLKDGTNMVSRPDKVAVITDIGLDHTHMLGETLQEIAGQKIGIVKPGNTVFTYLQPNEVMAVYEDYCSRQKAYLKVLDSPQTGDYRRRNWRLAHEVYKYLANRDGLPRLSGKALEESRNVYIPGRFDVRKLGDKTLIMDGAHNPQKMAAFVEGFKNLYPRQKAAVLISIKGGKDSSAIVDELVPIAERAVTTRFNAEQDMPAHSMDPGRLAEALTDRGVPAEAIEDQLRAVQALLSGPEDICIITGSFYLLGQIRSSKLLE